jgi:putative transposase
MALHATAIDSPMHDADRDDYGGRGITMNSQPSPLPMGLFDPDSEVFIVERKLPHWSQPGAMSFITWRTNDSMPRQVLDTWFEERARLLQSHGINPTAPDWREKILRLGQQPARNVLDLLWNRWHDALDAGHGACALRQPDLAAIVAKSLQHFDKERYILLDFVVMSNHVHLIASFPDEQAMLPQSESWKHFTASHINRCLGIKGRFWQQDAFDHLIRSEEQFQYLRQYIANNPEKAGLRSGEFVHYSKAL